MRPKKRLRDKISKATHDAVRQFRDNDGIGSCMYYAVAGAHLACRATGEKYIPQVGCLEIQADPSSEVCWWIDSTLHADPFSAGEFHCWFVRVEQDVLGELHATDEIADLSARHYRAHGERGLWLGVEEQPQWKRGDPPDYVWLNGAFPDWLEMIPDPNATQRLFEIIEERKGYFDKLFQLTIANFQELDRIVVRRDTKSLRSKKKAARQRKKWARQGKG